MSAEKKEIRAVISYVGHEPWEKEFEPEATVKKVKVEAMTKGFHLEASAADNYALQQHKADLPEEQKIGTLGENPFKAELVLKKEPHKGSCQI